MKLPRKTKNTLTHSELVLLRTFAVGMGRLCVLDLIGIDDLALNLKEESQSFLAKNLYRVQKLSSRSYEFRLAYQENLNVTQNPAFIRISNFGS